MLITNTMNTKTLDKKKINYDNIRIWCEDEHDILGYTQGLLNNIKKINREKYKLLRNYQKKLKNLYYNRVLRKSWRVECKIKRVGKPISENFYYRFVCRELDLQKKINILLLRIQVQYLYEFHVIYSKKKNITASKKYTSYTTAMRGILQDLLDNLDCCIFITPTWLLYLFIICRNSAWSINKKYVRFASSQEKIPRAWLYTSEKYQLYVVLPYSYHYCLKRTIERTIAFAGESDNDPLFPRWLVVLKGRKLVYELQLNWVRQASSKKQQNKLKKSIRKVSDINR